MALNGDNKLRTNLIIVDDFYFNPNEVREFALKQEFKVRGNFPGLRTQSFINEATKNYLQAILKPHSGNITKWDDLDGLTGSFEIATSFDRSWMHTDHHNTWAGIIYLTPNAPVSGGTGLFKHKATESRKEEGKLNYESETQDLTKWELVDKIGNIFNRLVLYRSDLYHTSLDYFGKDKSDGRLFQLFFLTTEY
jgi:hypothetical protein